MSQERWFFLFLGVLAVATCLVFRAVYPANVAEAEAGFLIRMGKARRVAEHVDSLAGRIADEPNRCLRLAHELAAAGHAREAAALLEAGWEKNPFSARLGEALAGLRVRQGLPDSALAVLARLETLGVPPTSERLDMEAGLLIEKKELAAAAERLEKLARSRPDDAAGWMRLGGVLAGQERFDEAAAAFRKALEADPNNIDALLGCARSSAWAAMKDARSHANADLAAQ